MNVLQNRASDVPKLKGDKELKPVSLRVKDAAEALLTSIMEHVVKFLCFNLFMKVYSRENLIIDRCIDQTWLSRSFIQLHQQTH